MSQAASRAVVVGGASGIGWAVAKGLAAEGRHVTIADRNAEAAAEKARELGAPHDAAHVEVTDEASVAALFDATGPIDVVVNTAGFGGFGRITEQPVDDFRATVDCCLTGGFIVMKHAGRRLRDGGSLVSITSLNARLAAPGMSAYCAAKAGLAMLTQVGVPEDVAEAVLFLCSDKASWLTGEVLDLNGGARLKRYPDVLAHVDRMASA